MARIETVQLIDDLDGESADETVSFALDGKLFEIDLSEVNAATFRDKLAPFVSVARTATGGRRVPRTNPPAASGSAQARRHNQAIRTWARDNGYDVSARGRIPAEVLAAYHDNGTATSTTAPAPAAPDKVTPATKPQPAQFSG
ncbi:Lsr2 family protein [Pseudonocardia sp. TMWB2A]|uniref:histone-like nucleoid-structuring protein Lsr2 n=1 Tax=Pseudonocardia sp. TMWB2A TaxID=687430 RepID=UPI00307F5C75